MNEWPGGLLPEQCRGESVHWKWVPEPIVLNGTSETLEMHAQALPANEFNQGDFVIHGILPSRPPDDGCMKGFVSRVREPNRTITTRISFKPPPGCRENPLLDDPDLAPQYPDVNLVKLNLEPSLVVSWPEGFFPRTQGEIHSCACVGGQQDPGCLILVPSRFGGDSGTGDYFDNRFHAQERSETIGRPTYEEMRNCSPGRI